MGDQDGSLKKKRMVIIGLSSMILVAMVVAVAVGANYKKVGGSAEGDISSDAAPIRSSTKAVAEICQPTDYKEACFDSLSSAAKKNTTDPKELVKLAFNVTVEKVRKALSQSKVLQEAEKDPKTKTALENCEELMDYAIDDLENSLKKFEDFDLSQADELVNDIKIWISGSITYQETCLDGFDGTQSEAAEKLKKTIVAASQLSSNALAIIDQISAVLDSLDLSFLNRKLLSTDGGYPSWVSATARRLLQAGAGGVVPDAVVAKDGSGKYNTITAALAQVPKKSKKPFVIRIKAGVYNEMVMVEKHMWNVIMIGDGPTKTKITGNKNYIDGTPTFKTATVAVVGAGFIAKDIGFENSAGAAKHQAVALRVQSDQSVFYRCQMDGYQDTLYTHTHRQFYRECTITGTIDFIFGNAAVVFQDCKILARKPMANQQNIVTAQGRKDRREPTAIILHNCKISADPTLFPVRKQFKTYLGRPWKMYSRTFIFQSEIDDLIQPEGWLPWLGDFALNTCFYSEFDNRGDGAPMGKRATWRGIKKMTPERATKFTVQNFIHGNKWIRAAGVPFTPLLLA
ncbi:hypothetical protein ACLOJK_026268 [Asimina triloba]